MRNVMGDDFRLVLDAQICGNTQPGIAPWHSCRTDQRWAAAEYVTSSAEEVDRPTARYSTSALTTRAIAESGRSAAIGMPTILGASASVTARSSRGASFKDTW